MIFKAILSALDLVLPKVGESFLTKVGDLIADNALNNVKSVTDFELTAKTLENNLNSLSAKASDVEKKIKNAELSGQKKRKREVEEWLRQVKSIDAEVQELGTQAEGIITRLMDGGKAAELNQQVEYLYKQSHNFGELLLDVCETEGVRLLTTGMVGEAFEENLERIWSLLKTEDVPSIGIYGMGGSGKTTLAKEINNRLVAESEGVFWVTVSQDFTIKSLQDKIAHSVGAKDLLDGNDEVHIRAAKLYKFLSQEKKNSLLIFDDVWENIDMLKVGCPISKDCCRLIITTRSLKACHHIGCQEIIAVQQLDEDEAWKLFSETFTLGKEIKLSPEAEEIAKSVAKLCGGLPLGIIVLGGSMRGEKEIYKWRDTFVQLKESIEGQNGMGEGDEVFKVLKYSFDRLNKHDEGQINEDFNAFQLCFLYCSLYPEDHVIDRAELVRKLISEGLLDQRKSRRAQFDQGHRILGKLVDVCLLESCVDYDGNECVKMHDLVRGMALQIGGGKYLVRAGKSLKDIPMEEEWTVDLEKVSLMRSCICFIEDGTSPDCPSLSTLLLQYNPYLKFIPDSFFTKMQGLCTLDLSETRIKMLPNSVSELKSLKALLLESCWMLESVPYLGKLKALRELNLDYTAIKEVPQGVEELLNLKFLSIDAGNLGMLPQGLLLDLGCLQCVRLPYHLQVAIEEVENLKQLEVFWGRVKNVPDFNSFIRSRVHDTSYAIKVGSFSEEEEAEEEEEEDFLGNFNKKVVIRTKCSLNDEVLGQDIECLTISQCECLSNCFLDAFSPSNYPRSLKKLKIEGCGGIECIVRREQEFSTLEDIQLENLDDFEGLVIQKGGMELECCVFSSLRWLVIGRCNKMRKLGLPVLGCPNLEAISIKRCHDMEEIFEDEGRGSDVGLPRLTKLSLSYLPKLKSVFKATIICNSIQQISISECRRLRKLELPVSGFPNLEAIWIERCSEMEEIFEDEGRGSGVGLPRLRRLRLSYLPSLKSVCKATIICNSIKKISISGCRRLRKLELPVSGFPNLEAIWIEHCSEMEEIFEDEGRGSGVGLPRLTNLSLSYLPSLKSVCKATIICNSIQQISIVKCPRLRKLELPVLGCPNLEAISIKRCDDMEEIFEDEGRGSGVGLPRLRELSLSNLPSLKSVCKATIICNSIQQISIVKCPILMKKLPLHMDVPPPSSLRKIRVEREWWESLEWDNPNLPTLLQPLVQFYRSPLDCN